MILSMLPPRKHPATHAFVATSAATPQRPVDCPPVRYRGVQRLLMQHPIANADASTSAKTLCQEKRSLDEMPDSVHRFYSGWDQDGSAQHS